MDMRTTPNGIECRENRSIDLDGMKINEVSGYLVEQSLGLLDVSITIESERGWEGESYIRQYVSGWRLATEEERRQDASEREAARKQERAWQDRQAEMLRKSRPDLFQ